MREFINNSNLKKSNNEQCDISLEYVRTKKSEIRYTKKKFFEIEYRVRS